MNPEDADRRCRTCGGSGNLNEDRDDHGHLLSWSPCPDCRGTGTKRDDR